MIILCVPRILKVSFYHHDCNDVLYIDVDGSFPSGMCMKQYSNTRSLTVSMLLVTLYQGFYVWDALYQEVTFFCFFMFMFLFMNFTICVLD